MKRLFAAFIAFLLLGLAFAPAQAHEAHRKNMSDAEMAAAKETEEEAAEPVKEVASTSQIVDEGAHDTAAHGEINDEHKSPESTSVMDFLGNLHPALVHFPIALFLAAGLAEFILAMRPASGMEPTVRFLVYTGAAGGLAATMLGWLAGGMRMSDRSETLGFHRWTGTGIAVAGLLAALLLFRGKDNRLLFRLLLVGIATALVFQGYWGAEMSLGPNHMGMS